MIDVPIVFAFLTGQAAAFNPCGAAMLPAYVGYQLGTAELKHNPIKTALSGLAMGLSATVGFIVVFGIVGLVLAAGGRVVGQFLPFVGLGVGITIAGIGAWLLLSGRNITIMAASRVNIGQGRGLKNIFLFGIAYAIASLSCALPLFLVAVGIVAGHTLSVGSLLETIIASIAYGLGMGVVMVGVTVGVVFFKEAVSRWIKAVMLYVEPIGKLAMIGAGAYLIYYWSIGKGSALLALRSAELF